MLPDDVIRLRHMAEAAEQAIAFCAGRQRADIAQDAMLWDTVQLALPGLLQLLRTLLDAESDRRA